MFVILWEFQVKPGFEEDFVRVYGADGDWAQLFRKSSEYRGTRLARDADRQGWFFTIDMWDSQQAFESFRTDQATGYAELDRRCESWTLQENRIGTFG